MTNKEDLQKKFKNKFVQDDYIIGSKETQEPVTLEEIFDFFWQEIEQARRARDEEIKGDIMQKALDSLFEAQTLRMNKDGSVTPDVDLDLMGKILLKKLSIIKHQDE